MKPRFQLTIRHKLLAATLSAMTVVIVFLGAYFSAGHLRTLSADLHRRATMYGALMHDQVSSAVAFSDRETARAVLASLDTDPDVSATVLYGADHSELYARGQASPWVARATTVDSMRVVDTAGFVSAIVPVVSLEGPRGTLVIQLSTARLDSERHHVLAMAVLVGIAALAFGGLVAWLVAGQLARRLARIAHVATIVTDGDLEQAVGDPQTDEIGTVGRAFDAMIVRVRHLIARQRHAARREKESLEAVVVARTAQLDLRNAEMRYVFDHVDQGFLIVGLDGRIADERSAATERWLGPIGEAHTLVDYVRTFDALAADWFEMSWSSIADGSLPVELCLAQLPSRFEVGGRSLAMEFKALTDASDRMRVLIVISDRTAEVERERANRDEQETTAMLSRMLHDAARFRSFCGEATQLVAAIAETDVGDPRFGRAVHTLKGICSIENLPSIAEMCHELESSAASGDELGVRARGREIATRWQLLTDKLAPIADNTPDRLDIAPVDLARLEAAVTAGEGHAAIAARIADLRCERVRPRLEHLADQARLLASRLCKDPLEVSVVVADDLRLPADRFGAVWTTVVHVLRNAIDHGLETASERTRAGKPAVGELFLRAERAADGDVTLEIEDRGRGIDWGRVADSAIARGLPASTRADLEDALFIDGLSTRDEVTETSGRGVGLAAFRAACVASGGRIAIASMPGAGTVFTVTWPQRAAVTPVVVPSPSDPPRHARYDVPVGSSSVASVAVRV